MLAQNRSPLPSLSIPISTFDDFPDSFAASDNIAETPEYEIGTLNLGAETPESALLTVEEEHAPIADSWSRSGFAANTSVPTRCARTWRSSSSSRGKSRDLNTNSKNEVLDRDCGICFEVSVVPSQTSCCNAIFCLEHISDWLYGPASDGRCPACQAQCTIESSTLLPSSASHSPTTTRPRSHAIPSSQPSSPILHTRWTEPESLSPGYRQTYKPVPSPLRTSSHPATLSSSSSASSSPSDSDSDSTPPTSAEPSSDGDDDKKSPDSDSRYPHKSPSDKKPHDKESKPKLESDAYDRSAILLSDIRDAEMSPWETNLSKSTGQTLGRLTSVVGMTMFLYLLLGSR